MTTPDIPAALAVAQADQAAASVALQNAIRRTAELQAALDKPKPFVRALEAKHDSGGGFRILDGGVWIAGAYGDGCETQCIDPAEFANAVRLAMCMRDFVRRYRSGEGVGELSSWLAYQLGLTSSEPYGSADAAARAAGWLS